MGRLACAAALALAMAGACGAPEPEPAPTGGDEQLAEPPLEERPTPLEEPEPPAEPTLPPLEPDTACGRAQTCCRAFVEATPNVRLEASCAGPAEAAEAGDDAACERMRLGWAQALGHRDDVEVPAACQLNE